MRLYTVIFRLWKFNFSKCLRSSNGMAATKFLSFAHFYASVPSRARRQIEWSPAEWFKYSINEFNQYSNNEMTNQSLFKNIHEHTWALSSYFNQKWHFYKRRFKILNFKWIKNELIWNKNWIIIRISKLCWIW